jgi:hypothetical protein
MTEPLGISLKQAPELYLLHALCQQFRYLIVYFLCDLGGPLHQAQFKGRLDLAKLLGEGRCVYKLNVSENLLEFQDKIVGCNVKLEANSPETFCVGLHIGKRLHRDKLFQRRFPSCPAELPADKENGISFQGHEKKGILHGT